jgi:hypothetical protein
MTRHSLPPRSYPRHIAPVSCHVRCHHPSSLEATHTKGEWLRVVRIARIHWSRAVVGQRDWSRRALASVIAQPVRSTSSLFRLPFILYDSPFLPSFDAMYIKTCFRLLLIQSPASAPSAVPFIRLPARDASAFSCPSQAFFSSLCPSFSLPLFLLFLWSSLPLGTTPQLSRAVQRTRLRLCPFMRLAMPTCLATLARPCPPAAHPPAPGHTRLPIPARLHLSTRTCLATLARPCPRATTLPPYDTAFVVTD